MHHHYINYFFNLKWTIFTWKTIKLPLFFDLKSPKFDELSPHKQNVDLKQEKNHHDHDGQAVQRSSRFLVFALTSLLRTIVKSPSPSWFPSLPISCNSSLLSTTSIRLLQTTAKTTIQICKSTPNAKIQKKSLKFPKIKWKWINRLTLTR